MGAQSVLVEGMNEGVAQFGLNEGEEEPVIPQAWVRGRQRTCL